MFLGLKVRTCAVGMVLRDHLGNFIEERTLSFSYPVMVLEAESIGVK